MSITKDILQKEKIRLEKHLKELYKKSDTRVLSKAIECQERSNKALKKYIDTKEDKFMRWAEIWNNAKKHFVDIGLLQGKHNFYIDEIIQTESDIIELSGKIYYLKD